jgi:hypothetical protein
MQKLPLGDDCVKHMRKTPKAPPDIDIWVIDPPPSNDSTTSVKQRDVTYGILFRRETIGSNVTSVPGSSSGKRQPVSVEPVFKKFYIAFPFVSGVFCLVLLCSGAFRRFLIRGFRCMGRNYRFELAGQKPKIIAFSISFIHFLIWLIFTAIKYNKESVPWSAAAEFLESCRIEKVSF